LDRTLFTATDHPGGLRVRAGHAGNGPDAKLLCVPDLEARFDEVHDITQVPDPS
jgi:inorganic pyrophosphatase